MRRFWIQILFGVFVLIMNIIVSYTDANPYASLDWGESNQTAVPVAIAIFVVQALTYLILVKTRQYMLNAKRFKSSVEQS